MDWKKSLKENITTIDELQTYIPIKSENLNTLKTIVQRYPLSITKYYLSLIDPADPNDPIAKMAIPSIEELDDSGEFDTSGESENTKLKGLQHKYATTVLLLSINRCAFYCRHCFRKRLIGLKQNEILNRMHTAIDYIKEHKEVTNILITGGDAFLLENQVIEEYLSLLSEIEHLKFIRFGTRIPVVFPERIYSDSDFIAILKKYSDKKQIYVVTQFNHPNEITEDAIRALKLLQENRIVINNQAVLLKGVNDDPQTMANLQTRLVQVGVVPYYVFQCRPVRGVKSIYQLPLEESLKIIESSKKLLSGHGKRFKFVMSHKKGKIEILGKMNNEMIFKFHQAKDPELFGKMFSVKLKPNQTWLDDDEIHV